MLEKKEIIGLVELVKLIGKRREIVKKALVDTGATRTCIDTRLAAKAGMGPVVSAVRVKNKKKHSGHELRAVVEGIVEIKGLKIPLKMSLEDRSEMHHKVLIGRDAIFGNFIVDISRTHNSNKIKDMNE